MTKFARISLDFIETKPRNEGNKTFLSPYPGAFEQLFCPGGGAFASSFSKNANSRGSARGGGGWALLELTDALCQTFAVKGERNY